MMKQLRFLTHALESIAEIVSITDLHDRFIFVNKAFLEKYGYANKEIIGQHVSILGSRKLAPDVRKRILTESRKSGWKGEIYNRTIAGQELLIALSTSPIRNEQREIIGLIGIAEDITEKRKAEQELQTTRDQLSNIFGNLEREAFWSFDPRSKKVLYNSESMERIYKRPVKDFYADESLWKKVIHPDDLAAVEKNEQKVLSGHSVRTEYRIIRPDGEIRWLDETSIPVYGVSDELVRIDGVLIDITDRKQAEDILRESEQRFSSFMKFLPGAAWMKDIRGRYVYINEIGERIFHLSSASMRGRTDDEIFPADSALQFKDNDRLAIERGKLQTVETLLREDGMHYSIVNKFPILGSDGKPELIGGVAFDITDLKRAEEALKESEERFRQIAENIREVFWINDPGTTGLVYVSPAFDGVWGMPRERVLGNPERFLESILPEDRDRFREYVEKQTHEVCEVEYRIQRPNGAVRWIRDRAFPIQGKNRVLNRVAGVAEDITDRKHIEERLRKMNLELEERVVERTAELVARKDELAKVNEALSRMVTQLAEAKIQAEAASRAKSQFLTNVSHELRTPLNSVIGFANVLAKNKGGKLDPVEVAYAERILDNGKHLLDVISQILDLSKVEAGRLELERGSVAVDLLIRETVAEMEIQVRERGVKVEIEIPAPLRPIETDRKKLKQVLINLLGNALKFTERGSIKVRVERDSINLTPFRIDFIDTGIGIPGHLLDEIFEAFNQADNTTKRKYEGTGLGLTISRSLCELLGYELFVKSEEGRGSVFSLFLGRRTEQKKR
ncbi:MAG: PAS domain S-box protein [Bacteroidota bacterium]